MIYSVHNYSLPINHFLMGNILISIIDPMAFNLPLSPGHIVCNHFELLRRLIKFALGHRGSSSTLAVIDQAQTVL